MPSQEECAVEIALRSRTKIRIGLCPRAQPFDESMESLGDAVNVAKSAGIQIAVEKVRRGVPGFHNAGPIFAHFLMDAEATHLFFPADDCLYPPDILIRLSSHDKDVVGGIYRKSRVEAVEPANFIHSIDEFKRKFREGGVYETEFSACHSMMISRRVIEKMVKDYPELHYDHPVYNEVHYALMLPMIEDRKAWQDDFAFSIRARRSGFKLWDDYGCRLKHYCADFLDFPEVADAD